MMSSQPETGKPILHKLQPLIKRLQRIPVRTLLAVVLLLGVAVLAAWADRARSQEFTGSAPSESADALEGSEASLMEAGASLDMQALPPYPFDEEGDQTLVSRTMNVHTIIPTRPRLEILKYQVQKGDTLFGIAEKFGLKPETILWGNWYLLNGDPHLLDPGQELNILPVDGVLHQWAEGEGLNGVAKFYGVTAQDIIDWPGNDLDPALDPANPGLEEGALVVVPGGRREPPSWQMVRITRANPAVASILGPGACGAVSNGPIGDGVFGWPTSSTWISGYNYIPGIHEAIDIGGSTGNGIFAADDGVVVYSGWNDWGYGYVVVIDHGNGWQSLYAHLSQINVGCGQAVYQGNVIAGMGCTGNCSGTHLHFEMRSDSFGRVNPALFLP